MTDKHVCRYSFKWRAYSNPISSPVYHLSLALVSCGWVNWEGTVRGRDGGGEASVLVHLIEVLLEGHHGLVGSGHGSPCTARFGKLARDIDVVVPEMHGELFRCGISTGCGKCDTFVELRDEVFVTDGKRDWIRDWNRPAI